MGAAKRISATEAARSFSDVVSRVRYRGEEFIVQKGGEAVCRIGPVKAATPRSTLGDLLRLLEDLPPVDAEYRRVVKSLARRQGRMPKSPWES
jgi:antitoxin (DNA-binding transcriptional repressor) of toxin-antitoxin stability system